MSQSAYQFGFQHVMKVSNNVLLGCPCQAMFAMPFGKCLDTCGINGHKIIPALKPEPAKSFLFDQPAHQLGFQLFKQLWWQITHDLINAFDPVNDDFAIFGCGSLFSSFSQYKKTYKMLLVQWILPILE